MAGVNQDGTTFSSRIEVKKGDITQVGNIYARGNVNIGRRIFSETQDPS